MTARKRTENLQDVPIAATVLSGAALSKLNVVDVTDLGLTIPGFHIDVAPDQGTAPIISIRGQVQNDTVSTLDPSVAVYVDGIYWSRAVGADAALADVASVDVLKGPQGTLFGRNTTGGALDIHTNDPGLHNFGGTLSVTGGSYDENDALVELNLPLVQDKLAARLVYDHNDHDGYDKDSASGQRLFSQDNTTLRFKLLAQPTPKLRLEASYENFDANQEAAPFQLTYVQPINATAKPTQGLADLFSVLTTGKPLTQYLGQAPRTGDTNSGNHLSARTQTSSLTGSYDLGFGVLKLIGGYRKVDALSNTDLDGTPETIAFAHTDTSTEEYTGEAQLTGSVLDHRLAYAVGYYWFKEAGSDDANQYVLPGLNPSNPDNTIGYVNNRSQAGYFQGTYKLTDRLSLTAGVRYTSDHKVLISQNNVINAGQFVCAVPQDAGNTTPAACSQEFGTASSDFDYIGSLEYKITPSVLGYAKVTHGYRAGGDNLRGSAARVGGTVVDGIASGGTVTGGESFSSFAPETALTYEAGLKSEFFNRRLRVNVDGYYTDYTNIQRSIIVATATGGEATVLANAASADIYGGEAEAQAIVLPGLRLGASLAVTEASYNTYQDQLGNHVNEAFPYTPEVQYSLTGDYTHVAPGGSVNFHADWGWQSTVDFDIGYTNGGSGGANLPVSSIRQSPYGLLNLRAAYDLDSPNIEVAVFGRNVTDKVFRTSALDIVDAGLGYNIAQYGPPATFGVQLTYRFGGQ